MKLIRIRDKNEDIFVNENAIIMINEIKDDKKMVVTLRLRGGISISFEDRPLLEIAKIIDPNWKSEE